jgi:hypothetical protein
VNSDHIDPSPIIIEGDEPTLLNPALCDGGLPPLAGVENRCVFRASRDRPDLSDTLGYTYHHHVDAAIWRGNLYVAWNSCLRDEDVIGRRHHVDLAGGVVSRGLVDGAADVFLSRHKRPAAGHRRASHRHLRRGGRPQAGPPRS